MPIYPSGLAGGGPCPSAGAADLPAIHSSRTCTCICTLSLGQVVASPLSMSAPSSTCHAMPCSQWAPAIHPRLFCRLSHPFPGCHTRLGTSLWHFRFSPLPPWLVHAFYSRFPAAPSHPPLAHLHRGYLRYNNYRPHPPALLVDHLPAIPTVSACVSTSLALDCFYTADYHTPPRRPHGSHLGPGQGRRSPVPLDDDETSIRTIDSLFEKATILSQPRSSTRTCACLLTCLPAAAADNSRRRHSTY